MTKRDIAIIAVRILAIYTVITAFARIQGLISTVFIYNAGRDQAELNLITGIIWSGIIILIVLAIGLWLLADRIARRMVSYGTDTAIESRMTGADLQIIAFSVVGLLVLVQVVPELFSTVIVSIARAVAGPTRLLMQYSTTHLFGVQLPKLAIGLCLLFGSRELVGFIQTVRKGRTQINDETTKQE